MTTAGVQSSYGLRYVIMLRPLPLVFRIGCAGVRINLVSEIRSFTLFSACKAGGVDRVRRAIADGVDPKKTINKDSFYKETPLHTACKYVIINFSRRGSG